MSKVKKGGKGERGKGNMDKDQPEVPLDAERDLLNITITDLTQKLERMKARCIELEVSNVEFQRVYEQVDEDKADIIAYLKRQLQSRDVIILNRRLEGVQKQLEETVLKYEAKIKQIGLEYRNMSEQLTSEVNFLIGKLNCVREFRIQRDELMANLEQQKEDMVRLKKEMEARPNKLALDFQVSTQLYISVTTHRVIKENLALNNKLDQMVESHRDLLHENTKLRLAAQRNETLALMYKQEKIVMTRRYNYEIDLINRLTAEHQRVQSIMGDLQHYKEREAVLKRQLANANSFLERSVEYTNVADEEIASRSHDNRLLRNELNRSDANIVMLQKVLVNARNLVHKAVKLQETMPEEEGYRAIQESNLLNKLVKLFNTADLPPLEETGSRVKSDLPSKSSSSAAEIGGEESSEKEPGEQELAGEAVDWPEMSAGGEYGERYETGGEGNRRGNMGLNRRGNRRGNMGLNRSGNRRI